MQVTTQGPLLQVLKQLLQSAPDATVVVNQEGQIVFANPQTERLFGYRSAELLQEPVERLVPESFRPSHHETCAEYLLEPQPRLLSGREFFGRRKDGTEIPVEIGLSPIESEEGTLIVAAIRDLTQRKQLEQSLRSNQQIHSTLISLLELSLEPLSLEEHLERTLDVLLDVSWVKLESKGAIFLVEGEPPQLVMKAQRGLSDELLLGCSTIAMGRCLCGQAAETRQIVFANCVDPRHEIRFADMQPHGHYCVPILSEGRVLGVINLYLAVGHQSTSAEMRYLMAVGHVLAGIVKGKQNEQSLRLSEERFQLVLQATDAGIWDWDLLTNEVYFSDRWKKLLGYEPDEIGQDFAEWEDRLHPDDRALAARTIGDYLSGKTSEYELEHRLRHKDGTYRWIVASGVVVRDEHGRPYRMVGSHLDVTERKRSEQKLREKDAQLLAVQKIQEHLLPPRSPEIAGYDIAGCVYPSEFASGDFFDYLPVSHEALGIVIADVSGHDFSAALVTASASAHLRSFVEGHTDIQEVLAHTNSILCRETEDGRFITLLFACLEPRSRTLRYVNAGHPAGYVYNPSGDIKAVLNSNTLPLAVRPETDFPVDGPIQLDAEDLVMLVTDGVLEAQSPDNHLFGTARMHDAVRTHRHQPVREIIGALRRAVRNFTRCEELRDDATIVGIRVK